MAKHSRLPNTSAAVGAVAAAACPSLLQYSVTSPTFFHFQLVAALGPPARACLLACLLLEADHEGARAAQHALKTSLAAREVAALLAHSEPAGAACLRAALCVALPAAAALAPRAASALCRASGCDSALSLRLTARLLRHLVGPAALRLSYASRIALGLALVLAPDARSSEVRSRSQAGLC